MNTITAGRTDVSGTNVIISTQFFVEVAAINGIAEIIGAWVAVHTNDIGMLTGC
jgi:hypothetical protein